MLKMEKGNMHKVFIVITLFMQSCANQLAKVVVLVDIQYITICFDVWLGLSQLLLFPC